MAGVLDLRDSLELVDDGFHFHYTFGFSTHSVAEKRVPYPELTLLVASLNWL